MALILNIDAATSAGSVCLSKNGTVLAEQINLQQKEHASVIAPYIRDIIQHTGYGGQQIDAVALSGGPGSYTGLRVAASTAKGLCYAWDIPLIVISTLKMMAHGMKEKNNTSKNELFCPMIDARRMEVFTALYTSGLEERVVPNATILDVDFLKEYKGKEVLVFGTGMPKAKKILEGRANWRFEPFTCKASHLVNLAEAAYKKKQFADTAYFNPFYLKSVYLPGKKTITPDGAKHNKES